MNYRFQEYKKCRVVYVEDLDIGVTVNVAELKIQPDKKKGKHDRAKEKRKFERRVDEEWELQTI